jgi:hypothetical protein
VNRSWPQSLPSSDGLRGSSGVRLEPGLAVVYDFTTWHMWKSKKSCKLIQEALLLNVHLLFRSEGRFP